MFNLSNSYYTEDCGDFTEIRKAIGNEASIYFEMCHTVHQAEPPIKTNFPYDDKIQRRTTPNQFYTASYVALSRGCDGASTFNFVYYREHGIGDRGPTTEPPFYIHKHLGDVEWLSRQPQHYIKAESWIGKTGLPKLMKSGDKLEIEWDMVPTKGGWTTNGKFRVQFEGKLCESSWKAVVNGVELTESEDRSEPYENPYPQLLGTYEQYKAWTVPTYLLKDGINKFEVEMISGSEPSKIIFADLSIN